MVTSAIGGGAVTTATTCGGQVPRHVLSPFELGQGAEKLHAPRNRYLDEMHASRDSLELLPC